MSDAVHMLSDLASLGISLAAIYLSESPIVKKYNFGYKRAEVMGALVNVLIIWVVTGLLLYLAIHRLRIGDYEVSTWPFEIYNHFRRSFYKTNSVEMKS